MNAHMERIMPEVRSYDRFLLLLMFLLLSFGALMIYSSTSVINPLSVKKNISEFYYFKRHLFTMLIGFVLLAAVYRIKPAVLKEMTVPLMIVSFVLLLAVFVPHLGVTAGGARRWIRLWPSTFQPSELVKLSMVIFLARYLSTPGYDPDRFSCFVKPLLVMAGFQAIFLLQPDFGATMSLGFITLAILFIAGTKLRYMGSLMLLSLPVIGLLVMEPYRMRRVMSFLDPWKDAQGSGFQLVQSFIAFGSGGIGGLGLGESRQKLSFLPASHTDFIFCLVGEELGLWGTTLVILFFCLLFMRGISVANRSKDQFLYYLAYGLTLVISVQALTNFAVVTGLVPTKGLPLPFMSYGGSALIVNMMAVGMLLRISRGDEQETRSMNRQIITRKIARRNVYLKKGKVA